MGKKIIMAVIAVIAVLIGYQYLGSTNSADVTNISTDELAEKMMDSNNKSVFIDVREPDEFEAGHIEGMKNVPLSTLSEDSADFAKDAEIVLICRSGNRSLQAAEKLQEYGFTNLVNVEGGMNDWNGDVVVEPIGPLRAVDPPPSFFVNSES